MEDGAAVKPGVAEAIGEGKEGGDDGELAEFDAEIESNQGEDEGAAGEAEFGEGVGKAEAVDESEEEGDDPTAAFDPRPDVVRSSKNDGSGNGRFGQACRESHDVKSGEAQGEGVGQRESGDDFEDVEKRGAKGGDAVPILFAAMQDSGEQQCEEEENVVVAGPDVRNAFL